MDVETYMTPNKTSEVGNRKDIGMLSPLQILQIYDSRSYWWTSGGL